MPPKSLASRLIKRQPDCGTRTAPLEPFPQTARHNKVSEWQRHSSKSSAAEWQMILKHSHRFTAICTYFLSPVTRLGLVRMVCATLEDVLGCVPLIPQTTATRTAVAPVFVWTFPAKVASPQSEVNILLTGRGSVHDQHLKSNLLPFLFSDCFCEICSTCSGC